MVANRDVSTVEHVTSDRSVVVSDGKRTVQLPAEYVKEHMHLAYAATQFGLQGATVQAGHGIGQKLPAVGRRSPGATEFEAGGRDRGGTPHQRKLVRGCQQ